MPRPKRLRYVGFMPGVTYFKPRGIPLGMLEEIDLTVDELESLRLADLENLDQIKAAKEMKISQSTFQRILTSAHKKIAEALVKGKAIRVKGGRIKVVKRRAERFKCEECDNTGTNIKSK